MRIIIYLYLIILFTGFGCTYKFPEPVQDYSSGTLDVSKFIGLGDGYLAGYMDGALYTEGQGASIPAILAKQLSEVGLELFSQPDINSLNGFNQEYSNQQDIKGKWLYKLSSDTQLSPERVLSNGNLPDVYSGTLLAPGNFSVPFMKSYEVHNPALSKNIYYERFATDPGQSTLLSDVTQTDPSFFMLWIGLNDYMGFARSGGTGQIHPENDPITLKWDDLTPVSVFQSAMDTLLSNLLKGSSLKGVILEYPQFDNFPFFYLYPFNFIKMENSQLSGAFSFYTNFNLAVSNHNIQHPDQPRPFISFDDNGSTLSPQAIVVQDTSLSDATYPDGVTSLPKIRQLVEGEMILLDFPTNQIPAGYGTIIPASEEFYLNKEQILVIKSRVAEFNQLIHQLAEVYENQLKVVPLAEIIHSIAETGKTNAWGVSNSDEILSYDGVPLLGDLSLNSIFSLDGLHFNQRGNAFIANQCIKILEQAYQCKIPMINVNSYKGNTITSE